MTPRVTSYDREEFPQYEFVVPVEEFIYYLCLCLEFCVCFLCYFLCL